VNDSSKTDSRSVGILEKLLDIQLICLQQSKRMVAALEEANRLKKYELKFDPNVPFKCKVMDLTSESSSDEDP
jgi:hypothetical protein